MASRSLRPVHRPRPSLLLAAVAGGAVAALPLGYLLVRAAEIGPEVVGSTLARSRTLELLATSLGLTLAVGVTTLLVGIATAVATSTVRLPGGRLWWVLAAIPLAMPSYVAAFGWLTTVPGWTGFWPSWLVLSAVCTPYVTLPVAAALRRVDPDVTAVARTLGLPPVRAWLRTVLPQVLPAAAAGSLLVALYVLSDFGAVAMLRLEVFTYAIARQYGSFVGREEAVVLALVLVVLALTTVAAERLLRGRGERWRVGRGTPRPPVPRRHGRVATVAVGSALLVVPGLAVAVPVVVLFRRLAAGTARALDPVELATAAVTTAGLGVVAAAVAVLLALPIGMLAARHRGRLVAAVEALGFTGHALPGIVVALSLVAFSLRVVPSLYQGVTVLVLAYVVLFLPKAIGATRTSVALVPPVLPDVARTLGRSPLGAHVRTTGVLAAPGVAAGALLVMLTVMKELPATLLLRPTGLDTLATEVWSRTSAAAFGAAAPYALAVVVLAAVPAFALSRPTTWEGR